MDSVNSRIWSSLDFSIGIEAVMCSWIWIHRFGIEINMDGVAVLKSFKSVLNDVDSVKV